MRVTPSKRATLSDVATAAGVSKMTASRALRGAGEVSAASIEKVQAAARALGYVGNHLAMSLSSQRADLIGVVVPSLSNAVFAEVLGGIAEALGGSGLQPVFGVTDYDEDQEYGVIRNLLSWNPAGLIVTGLDQPAQTRLLLENAGIPVVQIMDLDGTPVDASVGFSQVAAGRAMAEALLAEGRRRFGYVGCGLERDKRAAKRLAGFTQALAAAGLGWVGQAHAPGGSSTGEGRRLTAQLLAQHPELDCLYYSNDDVALGGVFHTLSPGEAAPAGLRLAGFNGLEFVATMPVPLATSVTPRREIGHSAAQIVLERIRAPQAQPAAHVAFTPVIALGRAD
jgi:LacI family gluconate utilization system Gnt-I transcriptional repressor